MRKSVPTWGRGRWQPVAWILKHRRRLPTSPLGRHRWAGGNQTLAMPPGCSRKRNLGQVTGHFGAGGQQLGVGEGAGEGRFLRMGLEEEDTGWHLSFKSSSWLALRPPYSWLSTMLPQEIASLTQGSKEGGMGLRLEAPSPAPTFSGPCLSSPALPASASSYMASWVRLGR